MDGRGGLCGMVGIGLNGIRRVEGMEIERFFSRWEGGGGGAVFVSLSFVSVFESGWSGFLRWLHWFFRKSFFHRRRNGEEELGCF